MTLNKTISIIIPFTLALLLACNKKHEDKTNSYSVQTHQSDSANIESLTIETTEVEDNDNSPENGDENSLETARHPSVNSFEGERISEEEPNPFSWCSNFEPSDRDVPGQIVYEGSNDYYIIEDNYGYVIAESYSGWPSEGDQVYGNLHSFGFKWVVNTRAEKEYKFWIEDYGLSRDNAIRWMCEHNHMK